MDDRSERETGDAMKAYLIDLGKIDYKSAHQFQVDCVQWRLAEQGQPDIFLVTEHLPVFTLGKRGGRESLVVSENYVKSRIIHRLGNIFNRQFISVKPAFITGDAA